MPLPSAFGRSNMNAQPKPAPKKGCKITTKTQNGKTIKSVEGSCTKQELEALKNAGDMDSPSE